MHTNTFCKYRKKLLASPRVHLVILAGNELDSLEAFHLKLLKHIVPLCPMGTCCV